MSKNNKSTSAVQFLWIGDELSPIEKLCLYSFLVHGHDVHLYTYSKVDGVPIGVTEKDANDILPSTDIFDCDGVTGKTFAGFADRFRYHLLSKKGGWWFDMDFVCLRELPDCRQLRFASTWEGEWGECANNCAIWCEPHNPHVVELRNRCDQKISNGEVEFGALGPFLVQHYVKEFGLQNNVAPWWEFCPIPWRLIEHVAPRSAKQWLLNSLRRARHRYWELSKPEFKAGYIRSESIALHLHNELWKANNLSKTDSYFYFSMIERLKRRYICER